MYSGTVCADNWGMRRVPQWFTLAFIVILVSLAAFAAKEFVMPNISPAKTYPAHDHHPMEKFTIAADPYDSREKAAIFKEKYAEKGYIPILVVMTNDGDQPVVLNNMRVELVTKRRDKIAAATEDDLYRRFSKVKRRGDEPSRNPLPIPLPGRGPSVGVNKQGRDEIDASMFAAKAVAPQETQAGFFFFDVKGIPEPLAGAHLYVTGLDFNSGQELMFFDIPMDNYLNRAAETTPK